MILKSDHRVTPEYRETRGYTPSGYREPTGLYAITLTATVDKHALQDFEDWLRCHAATPTDAERIAALERRVAELEGKPAFAKWSASRAGELRYTDGAGRVDVAVCAGDTIETVRANLEAALRARR